MDNTCLFLTASLAIVLMFPPAVIPAAAQQVVRCNSSAQNLLELGDEAIRDSDIMQATSLFEEAISSDPTCLAAYLSLADAYISLERYSDAVVILQRAKTIAPHDERLLLMLIVALYYDGRYAQVVAEANAARQFIGNSQVGFLGYIAGLAYEKLGDIDHAISWLELGLEPASGAPVGVIETKLLELYPQSLTRSFDPQIALKLGRLLYERSRFVEALSTLEETTRRVPQFAPPYYWLALVHIRLARESLAQTVRLSHYADARKALETYLRLAPFGGIRERSQKASG